MPKPKPILFTTSMVQAIKRGDKLQTRRFLKPFSVPTFQENGDEKYWYSIVQNHSRYGFGCSGDTEENCIAELLKYADTACPCGDVGTEMWVRETWGSKIRDVGGTPHESYVYKADKIHQTAYKDCNGRDYPVRWKPSIHMPYTAARLFLKVTGVRIERLNDISEADAQAEGLKAITKDNSRTIKYGIPDSDGLPGTDDLGWPWQEWNTSAIEAFKHLWAKVYGPESWTENPWVWVIEFEVLDK